MMLGMMPLLDLDSGAAGRFVNVWHISRGVDLPGGEVVAKAVSYLFRGFSEREKIRVLDRSLNLDLIWDFEPSVIVLQPRHIKRNCRQILCLLWISKIFKLE